MRAYPAPLKEWHMKNIPLKLQLTALFACLFLLGSCTSDSPGATGPLPERDPPVTLLVNGPPAKGILAGSSKTMDTLIWIFHADSGYTYSVVTSSDSAK